jgi:hypothetical protein
MTLGFAFREVEVSGGKPVRTRANAAKRAREWPLLQIVNRKTAILVAPIRRVAMRTILALVLVAVALAACSKPAPPQGRWEGGWDDGTTFIAARMEIGADGAMRVSAPDVTDDSIASEDDRVAMRETMATRLAGAWGEIAPRPMSFDGSIFRKPGGIAPQAEWDKKTGAMTLYVYIGTRPVIKMPLRAVGDFSENPWPH